MLKWFQIEPKCGIVHAVKKAGVCVFCPREITNISKKPRKHLKETMSLFERSGASSGEQAGEVANTLQSNWPLAKRVGGHISVYYSILMKYYLLNQSKNSH